MKLNINNSLPKFKLLNILINDSYSYYSLNNSFSCFKSINNIIYIIYSTESDSLISYNLTRNQKTTEIKKAHNKNISNIHHYQDKINNEDFIISVSSDDNNIKLWKLENFLCLYNFQNVNRKGFLYSSCFLNDNNNIYIIASNCCWVGISEPIKIFDLKGNKIKEINNSKDKTFFIYTYIDIKSNKKYILTGNRGCVKSYNFISNNIYKIYCDNDNKVHDFVMVYDLGEDLKVIDACEDGFIRMWNFHSGKLIKKIKVSDDLYGICLWNNKYLLIGGEDKKIKILDLDKYEIIEDYIDEDNIVIDMKKINLISYGDCLITQNKEKQIKLWISEKYALK